MIQNGMKILACITCLLGSVSLQAAEYFPTAIDFGSVTYNVAGGGFSTILVTDAGVSGTSGSGNLFNKTGSAAGKYSVTNWETFEWRVIFDVLNPGTASYTVYTPGCGTVTVRDIELQGGVVELEVNRHWESKTYVLEVPFGAILSLESFEGTGECTISGAALGAVHYVTKNGTITKDEGYLGIPVFLRITPTMALTHDEDAVLNFGRICASSQTQTLTIWPDGSIASSNLFCEAQDYSTDSFSVQGVAGATFTVNLPGSATITNGVDTLTLSNFFSSCSNTTCTVENTHEKHFTVGATLTIPPHPSVGTYVGEYQVSVTY